MNMDNPTPHPAHGAGRGVGKMGARKRPAATLGRAGGHSPAAGDQKVGGWHAVERQMGEIQKRRQRWRQKFLVRET